MSDRHQSDVGSWFLAGKNPSGYDTGPGWLRSKQPNTPEFGTIMKQHLLTSGPAAAWVGGRLRFRAEVKTSDVRGWAGLWMRVDGPHIDGAPRRSLAFDNMQQRPLVGSRDWTPYEVVLDLPSGAEAVCFGLIVSGDGEAWVRSPTLEPVGADVPTTTTAAAPLGLLERGILEANLDPFLLALGWILERELLPAEQAQIRAGVLASDYAAGRWHNHELRAEPPVRLSVAREIERRGIRVRLDIGGWERGRAAIVLALCGRFVLVESMLDAPD